MMKDSEYIETLQRDPEKGFRMLMAQFREPIYWHIRRLVIHHDDAMDATQETFINVFRSVGKFRGDCTFRAWIYRIATNKAINLLRKRRSEFLSIDDEECSEVRRITAEEYVDFTDLEAVKLQNAILSLPPKQQMAFNMRYYDEMDYGEIAEVVGSSASSVKASYHIAKEKIIKYMESYGTEI